MAEAIGLKITDRKFWDRGDLRREVDRIFDVCNGCRLCFKFCGSFPAMFEAIDGASERRRAEYLAAHPEVAEAAARRRAEAGERGEPEHVPGEERAEGFGDEMAELSASAADLGDAVVDRVVDLCFQCKLCHPNCPYTPPHEYALDFPRLLLRWKAHRVRRDGVPLRTRLLRDAPLIGKVGSLAPALANAAAANRLNRVVMEKTVGIHRDKRLPPFHAETFPRWFARRERAEPAAPLPPKEGVEEPTPLEVALFSTCLVDYHAPETGKATVRVLEHQGVEVVRPAEQVCCGMPYLDGGDVDAAARQARRNVEVLGEWVAKGYRVVIPSPSCSLVVREEYPQLLGDEASRAVASAAHDAMEFVFRLAREGRLRREFARRYTSVRYHVPCHLRVQNIGLRARDLLRLVADRIDLVQECSGHDGTWSMQTEHFAESLRWGRKAAEGMTPVAGETCGAACSDCGLAALHIRQGGGAEAVHPMVVLAHAYGFDVGAAADGLLAGAVVPRP